MFSCHENLSCHNLKKYMQLKNTLINICTFCKEINTFIQQECIKLFRNDSKDISNITKDRSYSSKNPEIF